MRVFDMPLCAKRTALGVVFLLAAAAEPLSCARRAPPVPPLGDAERAALPPESAGDIARSIARLADAPDDPAAWRAYARLADALALRERAAAAWARLADLKPNAPAPRYHLARNLHELGLEEQALDALDAALRLAPDDPAALRRKARWLLGLGRVAEAEAAARRALARDPSDGEAALVLARAALARGDHERAAAHLERLARTGQVDGRVARLLAQTLARLGRREEAERWAARSDPPRPLSPDPWMDEILAVQSGPKARYARAFALLRRRGPRAALPELRALFDEHPDEPGLLEALTEAEAAVGAIDRARERLRRRLAERPEDHRALLLLADLEKKAGRPEEAALLVDRALAAQPDSLDVLLRAVEIALERRDGAVADTLLSRAARLAPADPRVRELAARLGGKGAR